MAKLAKGDFAKIEFTGKRSSDGHVFDTTSEAAAKDAGLARPGARYGPVLVVVGKGMTIAGIDEALDGMDVGETKAISVPPEKAYGLRSPALVRVIPLSEFRKRDVAPYPGLVIEIDNRSALVKSVNSGRVVVDLNHPLAGETLSFDVKVADRVEGTESRAKALAENGPLKDAEHKFTDGKLDVAVAANDKPESAEYFVAKNAFIGAVRSLLPEVKQVTFRETYTLKAE